MKHDKENKYYCCCLPVTHKGYVHSSYYQHIRSVQKEGAPKGSSPSTSDIPKKQD